MRKLIDPVLVLSLIFLVFFMLFLWGAAPSVFAGDSGELQTVALSGGVAHASGYPSFILAGQVFGRLLGGDPARRITVMSSFFAALALCVMFMVNRKLGLPTGLSIAATVIYGLSFYFWWSALRAEVYTQAIFLFLVSMWLTLHALESPTLRRAALAAASLGLSMTGHLCCAPAVFVMGMMLLFSRPIRSRWLINWPVIAIAFVAGLTPYLYLVWADAAGLPVNYLDYTIELSTGQYGLSEETFSNPFRRVFWLIAGQESNATNLGSLRQMARTGIQLVISLFIYQASILALPLFVIGSIDRIKNSDRKSWLLTAILVASSVFCVIIGTRRLLMTFEWPINITVAILIAFGMRAMLRRLFGEGKRHRLAAVSTVVLLTVVLVGSSHLIRYRWDRSDRIHDSMKLMLEQGPPVTTIIPDFSDYWEPRIRGESILKVIPENSLVVFRWRHMAIFYLHHIEGMRPDIELEPYNAYHFIRLRKWAETYDLAERPIVFLGRLRGLVDDIEGLTVMPFDEQEDIYVCRGPLRYNADSRFIRNDNR